MSKRILSLVLSLALSLFVFVFPVSADDVGLLDCRLYFSTSTNGSDWESSSVLLSSGTYAFDLSANHRSYYIRFDKLVIYSGTSNRVFEVSPLSGYSSFSVEFSPFALRYSPVSSDNNLSSSFNSYIGSLSLSSGSPTTVRSSSNNSSHGTNFFISGSFLLSLGPFLDSVSVLPGFFNAWKSSSQSTLTSWDHDLYYPILPDNHYLYRFGFNIDSDQEDVTYIFSNPPIFHWDNFSQASNMFPGYIVFSVDQSFYPTYRELLTAIGGVDNIITVFNSNFLGAYAEWQSYYDYFVEDFNETMQRKLDNLIQDSDDISQRMSEHDALTDAAFNKGKESYDHYQESAQDGYDSAGGAFSMVSDGAPGFNSAGLGDTSGGIWYSQAVADALHDPSLNTRGSPTVIDFYSDALEDYRRRLSELFGGDSSD